MGFFWLVMFKFLFVYFLCFFVEIYRNMKYFFLRGVWTLSFCFFFFLSHLWIFSILTMMRFLSFVMSKFLFVMCVRFVIVVFIVLSRFVFVAFLSLLMRISIQFLSSFFLIRTLLWQFSSILNKRRRRQFNKSLLLLWLKMKWWKTKLNSKNESKKTMWWNE